MGWTHFSATRAGRYFSLLSVPDFSDFSDHGLYVSFSTQKNHFFSLFTSCCVFFILEDFALQEDFSYYSHIGGGF